MRYGVANNHPVHALTYTWTGWPTDGTTLPAAPDWNELAAPWKGDGFALKHADWRADIAQLSFIAEPAVAPTLLTQRVKGRVQHALRRAGRPVDFSRKVGMRAIGHNTSDVVRQYVRHQLKHVDLADPGYRASLDAASFEDASVDLAQPAETNSGRYWYNLHLVAVTADRYRMGGAAFLLALREGAIAGLREFGCVVRSIAVMPDHLHAAIRGDPARTPVEIGVALQNATAAVAGCRLWQESFYVGTFSEYSWKVLR